MNIVDRMLAASENIWAAYYEHPFIKGIEDGTLDIRKFRFYIIQDYLYLIDYMRSFAIGVAKAKSPESLRIFSQYVKQITEVEMDIHRGFVGELNISKEEIDSTRQSYMNLSYTSYMLRVAYEEGEAEIIAAGLACAYSYEVICRKIAENNPQAVNHPVYGAWVSGYVSEEYHKENEMLINALLTLTETYSEEKLSHLIDIFVMCSRYELDFWNMSWKMEL